MYELHYRKFGNTFNKGYVRNKVPALLDINNFEMLILPAVLSERIAQRG